jgi:hypothetical protein
MQETIRSFEMKLVRKLFESSRKMRKVFPAFREGGTVHVPKACTDPPLSTTLRWIPSRLREGRASSAGRARGWGTRSGRKADPLRFGARDDSVGRGHPERRGNGCRAEGPLRSSWQAGATLEAKADPSGKSCPRDDSPRVGHPKRRGNGCRAEGPATTLKTKKAKSRSLVTTFLVMTPKTTAKGPGPATGKHVAAPRATRAAAARHTPPAFATACGSKVIASKLR